MMLEMIIVLLMFIGLIAGILTGHPIAFVFGGISIIFGIISWGTDILGIFVNSVFSSMNNYTLVAIPLFTLMANFLSRSNVAENLFESLRYVFGPLRGGLAVAVIVVSTIFAATTGVVGASVVTMGLLAIPILEKYKYSKELTAGVVTAGGTLGILIPPSIMLIVMGSEAQLSVGKLFLSSIVPGILLSIGYIIYVIFICWKYPEKGPALSKEEALAVPIRKRIIDILVNLVPPTLLIIGVLGSIFTGVATPTEASGVGAFIALLLTFMYRKFSYKMLKESVYDTAKLTAMVMFIVVGASCFTTVFMGANGDDIIVNLVTSMNLGSTGVFITMMIITFLLGMFIDWIAIILIISPIFLPLMEIYELDPLWAVTCIAVMLQTAFLTPPVGGSLFYFKGIAPSSITWENIIKGVIPFIIIMVAVVIIISVFPQIVLWLPNQSNI